MLWEPIIVRGVSIPGRIAHTAAAEGLCDREGFATPRLRDRYALLGRGGAIGLIVTGHLAVSPAGKMREGQGGIWSDAHIKPLARVAGAARRDGSRIFAQLNHGGIMTLPEFTGVEARGPSRLEIEGLDPGNRAMTLREVESWPRLFADAAWRAREAGFDGVELHMAHGFGLCQFISPFYNQRDDSYGGSVERRARLPLEVLKAVRERVGGDYPVIAKLNGREQGFEGGLELDDSVATARLLEEAGLDLAEISGGSGFLSPPQFSPMRVLKESGDASLYYREEVRAFRKALGIPITLVGGVRSQDQARRLVQGGECDLVGLCRPLIREPDLVLRWREGRDDAPSCVSCTRCLAQARTTTGVHCVLPL